MNKKGFAVILIMLIALIILVIAGGVWYYYTAHRAQTSTSPVLYSLNPSSGPTFTSVTINGSGFEAPYVVNFGGGQLFAELQSNGNAPGLTFRVPLEVSPCPPGPGASPSDTCHDTEAPIQFPPGTYQVSVITPAGTSNSLPFTVTSNTLPGTPALTSLSPSFGPVGTKVTITGSNLASNNYTVNFGSSDLLVYVNGGDSNSNPTSLTFIVPTSTNPCSPMEIQDGCNISPIPYQPGTYDVMVNTLAGGGSNSLPFTITSPLEK